MSALSRPALKLFAKLPFKERLHVRARFHSSPLEEVARRAPMGRIADVGCGHGLLSALLAYGELDREVVGIDPDARKIALAKASAGALSNVRFEVATVEELAAREPESFDAAVVVDVLYLMPFEQWRAFLDAVFRLLKPGAELLLQEAEADGSWRHKKALLQERVMVGLLGKTKGSGGLGFQPRGVLEGVVKGSGFTIRTVSSMGRGYTTPHVLLHGARSVV